ncbi:MAG: ATP-binding cassette domain-containing protein [Thermoanaerobaculia bacterium]
MIAAQFTSVTKHYGMVEALKGLDLTIRQGELTALLGANGAGKTSAWWCITGTWWQRAPAEIKGDAATLEDAFVEMIA